MADYEARTEAMEAETRQARYDFLLTEIDACYEAAQRDLSAAEDCYERIVHHMAELNESQHAQIESKWTGLRAFLDSLQERAKGA